MSDRFFYLTTPIYYVNAEPHLGHAYTTIVADALARWHRLAGDRVWFLTGTDEHGDKIAQAAAAAGVSPQAYADRISSVFRDTWRRLGISNDDYIRTTEDRHKKVVQKILQVLWEAGEIYLGRYGGHYCFGCERFYTEKEIVDGKCPDHLTPLTWIEEENYFFKMSKYQAWLIDEIQRRPDLIRPERYRNEILGFLRDPLQDLSISRPRTRLEWGIPLPFDDKYVTYVWFDALINYVSALGGPGDPRYETFWPHVEHLIGKDILKPHAVYWPCMLKAAGLPLYRHLNVHGYWRIGGGKMSKSVGNVVEALALADKYGNDAFRYFIMREMVFGLDADFSEEALVGRLNADLANDLGNLAQRSLSMIARNCGGVLPQPGAFSPADAAILAAADAMISAARRAMETQQLHQVLNTIWSVVADANRYFASAAPWALAKTDPPRMGTVLYVAAEVLRQIAILVQPFVPASAAKLLDLLAVNERDFAALGAAHRIAAGKKLPPPSPVFPRYQEPA